MKKNIYSFSFAAIIFLLAATQSNAQYAVGSNVVNVGIGLGSPVDYGGGSTTPVFSASFEHGLVNLGPGIAGNIGVGGVLSYQHAGFTNTYGNPFTGPYTVTYSWNSIFIGARGTWHPDLSQYLDTKKIDLYAALDLGYLIVSASSSESGPYTGTYASGTAVGSGLRGGLIIGGRYYFTESVGAFLELGYDVDADAKIGVAFKF